MDTNTLAKALEDYQREFKSKSFKAPFRKVFQKRNFHAFCVGTPKSGTHSIDTLLNTFRSAHEPDERFMIGLIHLNKLGKLRQNELNETLISRDAFNWLEMESSHYCGELVETLVDLYPRAKFVLTVRDCVSWVDSWFNHQLSRKMLPTDSIYSIGRENYYDLNFEYSKHDSFLKEKNLYPFRAYLTYWNHRNKRVLDAVDHNNLLVVKTHEISDSADKLAHFLGISVNDIAVQSSHQFKAKGKHHILQHINREYVTDAFNEICADVHQQLFPEISIETLLDKQYNAE